MNSGDWKRGKTGVFPVLTAYSYIRWSDVRQSEGDSQRRQVELRDGWLKANPAVTVDTSLKLVDRGLSGFHGQHRSDKHCLGQFVKLVESGRVTKGSYLLIENLDRLSREEVHDAVELLLKLSRLGVVVVQLTPVVTEFRYPVDMTRLVLAVVELNRGHSESLMKSRRVKAAWQSARKQAAEGKLVITKTVPGWCRVVNDKIELIPERAKVVRRIHKLAQDGYGVAAICERLDKDGVPVFGRGKSWSEPVVYRYLTCRSVIGEWQPGSGGRGGVKREKAGDPIPGYFPAAITEDVWYATQAAMKQRHGFRGRRGTHVNLFSGLLYCALSRGKIGHAHLKDARRSYVFNFAGRTGQVPMQTFPLHPFEAMLLGTLREIDPAEIGDGNSDTATAVLTGEGRLAEIDGQLGDIQAEIVRGSKVSVLLRAAEALELERSTVAEQLERDKRAAALPTATSWAEFKKAADLTDEATRLRLRAAIRDVVSQVWCVLAGHKSGRYRGYVQVILHGGGWRTLMIWADAGNKRSGRKPTFGIAGGGGRDDVLAKLIPMEFQPAGGLVPELTDPEKGPKVAGAYRADMLEQLRGSERARAVAAEAFCDCPEPSKT